MKNFLCHNAQVLNRLWVVVAVLIGFLIAIASFLLVKELFWDGMYPTIWWQQWLISAPSYIIGSFSTHRLIRIRPTAGESPPQ